jgi:hypothetical protein
LGENRVACGGEEGALPVSTNQLVRIRQQSPGICTAEVIGLPEVQATAGSSEEAVREVKDRLQEWLLSGQLVPIELHPADSPPLDPNDPLEQEFLKELERYRREDLERTLQEDDQQCSNSSSTPTT